METIKMKTMTCFSVSIILNCTKMYISKQDYIKKGLVFNVPYQTPH